ncbi:MAG: hypothetical protein PHP50_10080 [Lachnospiraceae bacterium]|nr:hypothetical protein [Lachnospiraceae bacterium]
MAKFDVMEFGYDAGSFDQLVFHAKKFTKEEAAVYFNKEYEYKDLVATIENVSDGYVKYFIHATEQMSSDFKGGCYGFTDKLEHGAFPVWIITLSELDFAS